MIIADLLDVAFMELGVKELPGPKANEPEILKYFQEIGKKWVKTDETAWCSAAHNYVHKKAGYEYTGELNGQSWLDIGIPTNTPYAGCTVVFWYGSPPDGGPNGWRGHVAFWLRERKGWTYVLGGNQSNQYKLSAYHTNRALGYRIPKKRDVL
jgi:uncharacterized protein (TIGR02594 family)